MLFLLFACKEDKPINQFPEIIEISLSSELPEADQEITCLVEASDPEGKALTSSFSWSIGEENIGEEEVVSLSPEIASVGDLLTCSVRVADVAGDAITESVSATIQNTLPEVQNITLTPSTGVIVTSELLCAATGFDINDGEMEVSEYKWLNGEMELGTGDTIQLNNTLAQPNDMVGCQVILTDQNGGISNRTASVTIDNSPPVFDAPVEIVPDRGVFTNTDLLCTAIVSDIDGETPSLEYLWTVNDTVLSTTANYTVDANETDVDDEVICTVTARDANGGEAIASEFITVLNTRPEILDTQITSPSGFYYNDEILTCEVTVADIDGEPTSEYSWWVDGSLIANSQSLDLNGRSIFPHDILTCSVNVVDSYGDTEQSSQDITVGNRAPSTPTASIAWSTGGYFIIETDELICTGEGSVDPDNENLSYLYEWVSDAGGSATGSILSSSETAAGETWTCTATASDGDLSASVTTSLQLSPAGDPNCIFGYCNFNLDLGGGESFDMMLINGGTDPTGSYDLTHDYYMMTTEVTQSMFVQIMGYESYEEQTTSDSTGSFGVGGEYPAYHVNWYMAADFANYVTDQHNLLHGTNLNQCYSCSYPEDIPVYCTVSYHPYYCDGYRLPTEAEWEYAARSGETSQYWSIDGGGNLDSNTCLGFARIMDGITDPFLTDYAWNCGNNGHHGEPYGSKEIGQKYPNGYELFDIHGNLAEWTTDWHGCGYPDPSIDPYCETEATERVIRGGGWDSTPLNSILGYRDSQIPHERSEYTGARLIRMIYP